MRISMLATCTRSLFALTALITATAVQAQAQNPGRNLNVMAVNLDNHEIYSVTVTPPGGSTTVGNTDENNYVRPDALAFVTNATTNQLDLLVADNQRGTIYRYPGALAPQTPPNPTTGTLVWNSQSSGTGPLAPDALAVDGYGNLFVANSTSGHSQTAQLWEFPVGASGSGSFGTPVLLDSNFQNKETLLEVTFAPSDVAGANGVSGGDLIVLTTNRVLAYSQSSGYTTRITLLSFPNGSPVPGGMDFWSIGNGTTANYSLLVSSNSSGVINRYYFTNPLTAAPAPFYSGLGALYKIKTLFQQGNPLLFVSENGAILEFGANANGNGTLLATVTQNVTVPQGLAVSNSFTNAASVCLQQAGCNLTGLLTHAVAGVSTLAGNIVENVCTVNADPRVSILGGVWACNVPYTPPANLNFTCPAGTPPGGPGCLPVNAMCPGFDDTGKMAIPDTMCGRSGSSGAGFSLIKTLIIPNQFAGGYVQNSAVLADGSNPVCGPGSGADGAFLWAPLQAEGSVFESPNMVDVTSGCGSIHGGTDGVSVWGVGLSVNEAAQELTSGGLLRPLENFAQTKYTDLTTSIDSLTQVNPAYPQWTDAYPNIAASVSLELWGDNVPPNNTGTAFGCLDQSWLDFYNATKVDTDGSAQWIADLQNAANLLTSADPTGNTTCDGILTYAQATNPSAFVQTPNTTYPTAPIELNPYGQVRSRLGNLYYSINTRILGNAASSGWPLPVSVNVSPTSVTLASNSSPGNATLSWNTSGAGGCTLTSSDGQYNQLALQTSNGTSWSPLSGQVSLTIPPGDASTLVTYTVSCSSGPAATTVLAYVNVYPPPTLSLSPPTILQGSSATLAWNTNGAQGCTASSNDTTPADAFTGTRTGKGSMPLTPATGSYTYTLQCSNPATTLSASLTVVAPPTVSLSPASSLSATSTVQGTGATLSWTATGSTQCSWNSNDPAINGTSATTSPTAVNPASAGTYTYALTCNAPLASTSQPVTLTVVQQPTLSITPATVLQGTAAALTWNTYADSGCGWTSNDTNFLASLPTGTSGTGWPVNPPAAGAFYYTLTCASPTTPVTANLTVNTPQTPLINVSPGSIVLGSSANLTWTLYANDVCSASTNDSSDKFAGPLAIGSNSMTVTPKATGTYSYTLTCSPPAVTTSATLNVTPPLAKIAISVSGAGNADGDGDNDDRATLSWSLSGGATGCEVSGAWPPHTVPQFSQFPVTATGSRQIVFTAVGTYTYTLACTNSSAPAQTSVVIKASGDHD
jgi:hypothetical protein